MARTSKKSLESIEAEISRLKAQAEEIRNRERTGVIDRILEAISAYQITAVELGFGRGRSAGKTAKKMSARGGSKKPVRAAKFRDAAGNTWSGLGKRPNWFKDALASGSTPEQLLVK
jgi:DNA-binding protein H-NS